MLWLIYCSILCKKCCRATRFRIAFDVTKLLLLRSVSTETIINNTTLRTNTIWLIIPIVLCFKGSFITRYSKFTQSNFLKSKSIRNKSDLPRNCCRYFITVFHLALTERLQYIETNYVYCILPSKCANIISEFVYQFSYYLYIQIQIHTFNQLQFF